MWESLGGLGVAPGGGRLGERFGTCGVLSGRLMGAWGPSRHEQLTFVCALRARFDVLASLIEQIRTEANPATPPKRILYYKNNRNFTFGVQRGA